MLTILWHPPGFTFLTGSLVGFSVSVFLFFLIYSEAQFVVGGVLDSELRGVLGVDGGSVTWVCEQVGISRVPG